MGVNISTRFQSTIMNFLRRVDSLFQPDEEENYIDKSEATNDQFVKTHGNARLFHDLQEETFNQCAPFIRRLLSATL